jgi:hypothetical protein
MSIVGCAHLTGSSSSTADAPKGAAAQADAAGLPSSTPGASHPSDRDSAQASSASATSDNHDHSPGAGTSKNEPDNSSAAKARGGKGGTVAGTKTPSSAKGGSATDKGHPAATVNGPPTLRLTDLEQRLRDTHAIGVFTKLSLKNQIDDLLGQLHAYQLKQTGTSLPQLRQRYDQLLQKVIGLLQGGDASLARDISSSREAIWSILVDPARTSQL